MRTKNYTLIVLNASYHWIHIDYPFKENMLSENIARIYYKVMSFCVLEYKKIDIYMKSMPYLYLSNILHRYKHI